MLNEVSYEEVYRQIGQKGVLELQNLYGWLTGNSELFTRMPKLNKHPWLNWRSRYAPSIICRSEAELLGISTPRFAIRVYLPDHSFVNVRRIGPFCQQAQDWLSLDRDRPDLAGEARMRNRQNPWRGHHPARELERARCIADALLRVPATLDSRCHILTTRLGMAYGEVTPRTSISEPDEDAEHSPYVNPFATGGGLCAQSVCFMASALLHEHAKGVYGVAEVTALVKKPEGEKLTVSGLDLQDLASFFQHPDVGLHGRVQKTKSAESFETALREHLRAYVLSGFPVILPVDCGRMQGYGSKSQGMASVVSYEDTIYGFNSLPHDEKWVCRKGVEYPHGILVIGCGREERDLFIFHDQAKFPFMKATAAMLYDCAAYAKGSHMSKIVSGRFLPVTPRQVLLPLTNWSEKRIEDADGLIQIAEKLQSGFASPEVPPFPVLPEVGQFRLATIGSPKLTNF